MIIAGLVVVVLLLVGGIGALSQRAEDEVTRVQDAAQDFLVTWFEMRSDQTNHQLLYRQSQLEMQIILTSPVWQPLEALHWLEPRARADLAARWQTMLDDPMGPDTQLVAQCKDLVVQLRRFSDQQQSVDDYLRDTLWVILVLFVGGGGVLVWAGVRQRRLAGQLQQMHRASLVAVEDQRKALSRELHDTVAQDLAAVKLRLSRFEPGNAALDPIRADLDSALAQVRALATGLRPPSLDKLGFEAALRELCQKTRLRTTLEVIDAVPLAAGDPVSGEAALHLYRIAQEALANAIRHSVGKKVTVSLDRSPGLLVLQVADDGLPDPAPAPEGRLGLVGMQERAALVGATLKRESMLGVGTTIRVEVPL
jgi:signal transduction histidine kinase